MPGLGGKLQRLQPNAVVTQSIGRDRGGARDRKLIMTLGTRGLIPVVTCTRVVDGTRAVSCGRRENESESNFIEMNTFRTGLTQSSMDRRSLALPGTIKFVQLWSRLLIVFVLMERTSMCASTEARFYLNSTLSWRPVAAYVGSSTRLSLCQV